MKNRIFEIIERGGKDDKSSLRFDRFIVVLIILNISSIVLESFSGLRLNYGYAFRMFEYFSVAVFTLEYALRIWTSNLKYKDLRPSKAVVEYIFSPVAIIDFISIAPTYLPMFFAFDLRILRIFKLSKLLRILKLNRYSKSMKLLTNVLKKEKDILTLTTFITFLLMLLASTMMYVIESEVQPEAFPNIVAAFWWAIATLTTVGYGDVYPITSLGKFLSGLIALLGIGLVALPTGIISSGFLSEIDKKEEDTGAVDTQKQESHHVNCPVCGTHIVHTIREVKRDQSS